MQFVVFDKANKEVIAILRQDGECVLRSDVDSAVYDDEVDPVVTEINGRIYLKKNTIGITL